MSLERPRVPLPFGFQRLRIVSCFRGPQFSTGCSNQLTVMVLTPSCNRASIPHELAILPPSADSTALESASIRS